jgi:putative iron-only hydrogenase system regulator
MEKRIGTIKILIRGIMPCSTVNISLQEYSNIFPAQQGLPIHHRNTYIISLVIEGSTEVVSALSGKLGRSIDVEVKSVLTKYKEEHDYEQERTEQGIY